MEPDEIRFREIENKLNDLKNDQNIFKNDAGHIDKRFAAMEKRIDTIQAGVNRLIWTGGGLIIVAIGNFIIKGGLINAGT